MIVDDAIRAYLTSLPEPKRADLAVLHERMLARFPASQLWFLDGKDEMGKVVSNPNIGYGTRTLRYAGGKTREFYRVGLSANTTGISVYIMGIEDKAFLAQTYGARIGKASVTGYGIKFKALQDIALEVVVSLVGSNHSPTPNTIVSFTYTTVQGPVAQGRGVIAPGWSRLRAVVARVDVSRPRCGRLHLFGRS